MNGLLSRKNHTKTKSWSWSWDKRAIYRHNTAYFLIQGSIVFHSNLKLFNKFTGTLPLSPARKTA